MVILAVKAHIYRILTKTKSWNKNINYYDFNVNI